MTFNWADYLELAKNMRKSRNQADYDLTLTQTPRAMADLTIKSAEQTISILASLE